MLNGNKKRDKQKTIISKKDTKEKHGLPQPGYLSIWTGLEMSLQIFSLKSKKACNDEIAKLRHELIILKYARHGYCIARKCVVRDTDISGILNVWILLHIQLSQSRRVCWMKLFYCRFLSHSRFNPLLINLNSLFWFGQKTKVVLVTLFSAHVKWLQPSKKWLSLLTNSFSIKQARSHYVCLHSSILLDLDMCLTGRMSLLVF